MNSQTRREIRFGLIALALSGLFFTLGIPLRGPADLNDLGGSYIIRSAASPNYVPGWTMILVAAVLQLYGFFGLYRYLTYRAENLIAFLALVLRIGGVALFLPIITFLVVNGPVIAELYGQGSPEVIAVADANFASGQGLALVGVAAGAATIGFLLFAIAIWRDGRLPKWTVVLFVLSFPLLSYAVTEATEFLGAVILLVSTSVIAWKGWQETATMVEQ